LQSTKKQVRKKEVEFTLPPTFLHELAVALREAGYDPNTEENQIMEIQA